MNREIKFRAWWMHPIYQPKGKMYLVGGLMFAQPQDGEPEYDMFGKVEEVGLMSFEKNDKIGWNNGDECTLMQYTGLKDKNGEEIYEGDLLSDECDGDGNWVLHRVIWDIDHAGFIIEVAYDGKGNWQSIEESIYWQPRTKKNGLMNFEVIGNIYENPELLQDPISSNER